MFNENTSAYLLLKMCTPFGLWPLQILTLAGKSHVDSFKIKNTKSTCHMLVILTLECVLVQTRAFKSIYIGPRNIHLRYHNEPELAALAQAISWQVAD